MAAYINTIHTALTLSLAIAGFLLLRRRPDVTRLQLVLGAAVGGGLGGAVAAMIVAMGGAVLEAIPFAVLGLLGGAMVGLLGVIALALGKWLNKQP
jgi:hypothetical protein